MELAKSHMALCTTPGIKHFPMTKSIIGIFIFIWLTQTLLANTHTTLQTIYSTTDWTTSSNFILSTHQPKNTNISEPIFLNKSTQTVHILAKQTTFEDEVNDFKSFRKRYKLFWTIFNIMFITHSAWYD